METLIVHVILFLSLAYTIRRIVHIIKAKNDPCHDCPGCALKEQMQEKEENQCRDCKKSHKNFAK